MPKLIGKVSSDNKADLSTNRDTYSNGNAPLRTVHFTRTTPTDWTCINEGKEGHPINPIAYVPQEEDVFFCENIKANGDLFDVKVTAEEMEALKKTGSIRF